ncbi:MULTISPECIES: D-alanine--poly(phosphoribitol) ligase subunit DltC [Leuconostoc]|jgi:D-alanine--poly(phosphoribitol) ligase subunit 2|uniref:D-alanyl carrier protein n=1 Tax=Leuconostoc pseudomesenteroides TaxID=33968 RepID=A0A5B8SYA9_LEUPS|nr:MULTISPECIES: D-alanine--poly(phosphoribitol) ligase subunit DltC [Leuconostoc]MBK0040829.1 D-alanine--poly(phosphoribitol) ligase subunit DltC [Leuconostoc sp. S51]MBK0051378.1 D-alanine--poly(phosphoribitol) ligase subunit DltC [Leuconostoc sp. S50]MBS0958785.1 D-alanine--poly(phosphoribitol) ligase subunit DltC [Leuconostoc pseudomesenteroides]MCC7669359.1 D-alanine--poly(phosphoribitol) ligase subunit DltC [Leuconostoc pseudomesenteroides]MCC8440718.1 D-alanine--poly(phosphoribitol) lig
MDVKTEVVEILNTIIGEDISDQMDDDFFESGLLDSMATVELLLDLETKFDIQAPVSEFDRNDWNTPNKVIAKVESLMG